MRIDFQKLHGGVLTPATDMDSDKMTRYKTGEFYPVEIKTCRNPHFHRKFMGFFRFCFKYWCNENNYLTAQADYDWFRKKLTIKAGYYHERFDLMGRLELVAMSLSYGDMEQDEFEQCYHAVVQASMDTIFKGCDEYTITNDKGKPVKIYNKLMSFF